MNAFSQLSETLNKISDAISDLYSRISVIEQRLEELEENGSTIQIQEIKTPV